MIRSRRLLPIVIASAALLSVTVTSIPGGQAASATTDALRAKRSSLVAQLAALAPAKDTAGSALVQAEQAFNNAQTQLLSAQKQMASLNAQLLSLSGQITADEATISQAKQQLGLITRQTYETTATNSWVAAVLSANDFTQAMDRLTGTSHLAERVTSLQAKLRDKEAAIRAEKAQVASDQAATVSMETQLSQTSTALLVLVEQRNVALQAASAPARAIAGQIAEVDQQIAAAAAPPPPPARAVSSGSCGNHFGYGQCTYYVASRRCIPWSGNARDWFYQASAYGYPVGHSPQVGAVVVFWPGGDGASQIGHVGYVEAVGPSDGIPAGSFKLSEMNYAGWNRVSYRVLPNGSRGIQGFVYSK